MNNWCTTKCGLTRQVVFLLYMALWTTGVQLSVASQDKWFSFLTIHMALWLIIMNWCTSVASQVVFLPHMVLCTTGVQVWPHKTSGFPSTHGFMYWHWSIQDKWFSFHTWFYVQLAYKCGLTRQVVFLPHMVLCTTGIQVWPHKTNGFPSTHGSMYNWHTSVASQTTWSSFHTWLYVQLVYKCDLTRQVVFLLYMALFKLWTTGVQLSVASQDKWSSFYTRLYLNYEQLVYNKVWPHKTSGLLSSHSHGFMNSWHTSVASQSKQSVFMELIPAVDSCTAHTLVHDLYSQTSAGQSTPLAPLDALAETGDYTLLLTWLLSSCNQPSCFSPVLVVPADIWRASRLAAEYTW